MKTAIILRIVKLLYGELLRPLLFKAVNSTETDFDDMVLELCDKAFDYHTSPVE